MYGSRTHNGELTWGFARSPVRCGRIPSPSCVFAGGWTGVRWGSSSAWNATTRQGAVHLDRQLSELNDRLEKVPPSTMARLVELRGFEPLTSSMRIRFPPCRAVPCRRGHSRVPKSRLNDQLNAQLRGPPTSSGTAHAIDRPRPLPVRVTRPRPSSGRRPRDDRPPPRRVVRRRHTVAVTGRVPVFRNISHHQ
jgi:hypothetical protein